MVMMRFNKDLLPMKAHYFLFNAGTAPLVPYLPTYAKQLGFSSYMVGILYTFLPILGLIIKPVLGAIADRYEKHKAFFIIFEVVTICAFSGLYFIPDAHFLPQVDLACGDGETFFGSCAKGNDTLDQCQVLSVTSEDTLANCKMTCDANELIWKSVCEDWKVPKYCFDNYDDFNFTTNILKSSIESDNNNCVNFPVGAEVMFDGSIHSPQCHSDKSLNSTTKCMLYCSDKIIDTFLNENSELNSFMMCKNNTTIFQTCINSTKNLNDFKESLKADSGSVSCNVQCKMGSTSDWLEMCPVNKVTGDKCKPVGTPLPKKFNFTAEVPTIKTFQEQNCMYFKVQKAVMTDGTTHYPTCASSKTVKHHFHSQCDVICDNININEFIFAKPSDETKVNMNHIVWFFSLMSLNWIGMAVVVTIGDAMCFEKLGEHAADYGRQRLWGSVGWGILSFLTGFLIDNFSYNSEFKNYTIAFILMAIFLLLDIVVSVKLKYKQTQISVNILNKIGSLFSTPKICHFFVWIIFVGMCTGLVWQFLFWYLEDLAKNFSCDRLQWIKTLQGIVSGLQCFAGEIPFFFFSGRILKKIGHMNSMSLVLFAFGVRLFSYSLLTNPWYVLPIELLQGLTFGMFYATMTSYASLLALDGTEGTLQGLVGAIFEGVGISLGSFIGGAVYGQLGGAMTFRIFGCTALVLGLINVLLTIVFQRDLKGVVNEEYSSIVHYAAPNDAIDLTNDNSDGVYSSGI